MEAQRFWKWFVDNEDSIWNLDANSALDTIQRRLSEHCEDLEAEISDESDEEEPKRELIISAGGDASLFPAVEDLVANAPKLARWSFIGLKPPRGFDFELDCSVGKIVPEELFFEPMTSNAKPDSIGILVFVPQDLLNEDTEQCIRLVVETGIGERDSSVIEHIAVASMPEDPSPYLSLPQLGDYVKWFRDQHSRSMGNRD
jgi:hypothetical protein